MTILLRTALLVPNAALRCEQRLAILERSETAKRCESLLNALLYDSARQILCDFFKRS